MFYLLDAALFLAFTLALGAFGWAVWNPSRPILEATLVPGAAILGVWAFGIWISGSLGLYAPGAWGLALLALLIGVSLWKAKKVGATARRFAVSWKRLGASERAFALYLGAVWLLVFVLTLAPPSGADYDSLVYHLAVPAQYTRAGRIVELAYDHHSYFPFTLEMMFGAGLELRGAVFAKLFHWLMLLLGALTLVELGRRAHSKVAGFVAAALYTSLPMTLAEASTAYIDLGFTAWVLLAVLCFDIARDSHSLSSTNESQASSTKPPIQFLAASGLFCGLALGTKYFGALVFGFLGLWLLVESARQRRLSWKHLAAFAIPALILGAPWYVRNALWTGNPVYPFAYGVFGGQGWSADLAKGYDEDQAIYGFGKNVFDLLWLPWRLALTPLGATQPFYPFWPSSVEKPLKGFFEVDALALQYLPGPAVIALGMPALFARSKPRLVGLIAWFFAFLWVFWALTSQQVRYLFPALALLALVAGWGAAQHAPNLRISRVIGGAGLIAWLAFAPFLALWQANGNGRGTLGVISGSETPDAYLNRTFSAMPAMNWIGANTSRDAKFAVYGEPRNFYLPRDYFWADHPHGTFVSALLPLPAKGVDLWRALRKRGATHVLVNAGTNNGGAFGPPQPLFDEMTGANLALLREELRGYRIYELKR